MRAAVFTDPPTLNVQDVQSLPPGPRDVVVEVEAAGVCHSDLGIARGHTPGFPAAVLGHEAAGRVLEVGPEVRGISVGQRVITTIIAPCRQCWFCLNNQSHLCVDPDNVAFRPRFQLEDGSYAVAFAGVGAFAETMVVDESSLVVVNSDLPSDQLALFGCGMSTGLGAALNTADIRRGDTVVVIGCGGVGMAAIQGAVVAGAGRIVAVDVVASKRELAKTFGATDSVDPRGEDDVVETVRSLTGGRGVDVVLEAVGSSAAATQGSAMLRRGGTLVLIGMPGLGTRLDLDFVDIGWGGKSVVGCVFGGTDARRDIPRYLSLVESGRLNMAAMVSTTIKLAEVNEAFTAMESGEGVRSVIAGS